MQDKSDKTLGNGLVSPVSMRLLNYVPYVPSCLHAFARYVPLCLTCLPCLDIYAPSLRALFAGVPLNVINSHAPLNVINSLMKDNS